jgi:membrane fusion protein (multidrug efflux system)
MNTTTEPGAAHGGDAAGRPAPDRPAPDRPAPVRAGRGRILGSIALVFVILGIAWVIWWFLVLSTREKTDDAYVNGNKLVISAQVPGTVVAVLADDTQLVKAGQELVRLDPVDAQTALSRAASVLAQTVRQVRQQRATAGQFDAAAAARKLELARAEVDLARREPLLAEQAIAPEELRHGREAVALARAALDQALRQANAAHALVDGSAVADNPAVLEAKAAFRDAWVTAQRNAIVAPVTGYVAERSVQLGQHIVAGQALMTVVPLNELWIDANFKEVQLRHMRIGQQVEVDSDLYGGAVAFRGRVQGMAAGTGAAFALLPAQNASGNWIKVVQRVPVRIRLDPQDLAKYPLRIGLSTTVRVDTQDRSGPVLAADMHEERPDDSHVLVRDLDRASQEADAIIRRNLGSDQ